MSYEPNDWSCGDIVSTAKLNAMERGIADMNSEYVPNTWQCGDVITAEKLNHMEQGIANGGSGDFSTAQVTVVNNTEDDASLIGADVHNYGSVFLGTENNEGFVVGSMVAFANDSTTRDALLIKCDLGFGVNDYAIFEIDTSDEISVSGNCILNEVMVLITGDCTITINPGR